MYRGHVSRDEWGAAPPTMNAGPFNVSQGAILHWEGPSMWGDLWAFAHDSCAAKVRGIQAYHMRVGYSDIAYSYVICPHGYLFEGRAELGMANAASGDWDVNHATIAICFLWGDGDNILEGNPDPIDALHAIRNFWIETGGMSWQTRPHRSIVATSCPGDELAYVAGLLDGAPPQPFSDSGGSPAPAPPPVPAGPPVPAPDPVIQMGSLGPAVGDWQVWINACGYQPPLEVDGVFGPATEAGVKWFQTICNLDADGVIGTMTWAARRFIESLPPAPPAPAPEPPAPAPDPVPDPEPPAPTPDPDRPNPTLDEILWEASQQASWSAARRVLKRGLRKRGFVA